MKNIKKKLLSLGLTAAMVACYTPATIFADEIGNQGNVIEVSTYQELKEALGYNKYDAEKGAFVAAEGTAKEGDTIKLTADLIAETDKANPKGNKRTGDSETDARFDSTTGATVTVATNNVTIDGNGHTIDGDGYPTFDFDGVKGAELKNITVEDGAYTAKIGGAIFVEYGAEVSMDNITVKDSYAKATSAFNGGGAIYINNHRGDAPKVTITNSQFINNKVGTNGETGNGGAIYGSTANLTVENTTFKGNKAANGGAIAVDGPSEFSSKSNTFKRNKAAVAGGAVYVYHGLSNTKKSMTIDSDVKAQMTDSTFKNNSAKLTGDDVVYGRYYDETYTGDTSATTLTSDSEFTDVTFADKDRTQILPSQEEVEKGVVVKGVNVRNGATLKSEKIGYLKKGTEVEVVEKTSANWLKIKYDGSYAYVSAKYVEIQAQEEVEKGVVERGVNVRNGATLKSEKIGYLKKGTEVEVVEKTSANWLKIKYDGSYAYVSEKYIKLA